MYSMLRKSTLHSWLFQLCLSTGSAPAVQRAEIGDVTVLSGETNQAWNGSCTSGLFILITAMWFLQRQTSQLHVCSKRMNLSCREQLNPCCSPPPPPPTVVPLPEHCRLCLKPPTFSVAASWSFLCKGEKRASEAPTVLALKVCDIQIINPTICQQMSALNSGIYLFL